MTPKNINRVEATANSQRIQRIQRLSETSVVFHQKVEIFGCTDPMRSAEITPSR
jgi:hypothetical protein